MAKNDEELLKSIGFNWNGTEYTLEFNRRSIELLEKQYGMNIAKTMSGEVEISDLPSMFRAALMMHHRNMKAETADMLYGLMADKEGLMAALIEMLAGAVTSIFEEPDEGKAISWTKR